jgi:hypothetical protein
MGSLPGEQEAAWGFLAARRKIFPERLCQKQIAKPCEIFYIFAVI